MKKLFFLVIFFQFTFSVSEAQPSEIDSLEKALITTQNDSDRVNLMNELCDKYRNEDDDKSFLYADNARQLASKIKFEKGKADALHRLGRFYHYSDPSNALRFYNEALEIRKAIGDKKGTANTLNNIATIFDDEGKLNDALQYHLMSLKIEEELHDFDGVAGSLNNIGLIYNLVADYTKSLDYYLQSLRLFEKTGNQTEVGSCYINIGRIYLKLNDRDTAFSFYQRAYEIFSKINDRSQMAIALTNIGDAYQELEDFAKAEDNFSLSLKIHQETRDSNAIAADYINLGQMRIHQKKYDEALQYYQDAMDIYKKKNDSLGISKAYYFSGELCAIQSRYAEAKTYLLRGLSMAKSEGDKELIKDYYKLLSELYEKTNDFKKAFEFQSRYAAMKDSLLGKEKNKQIETLKIQYEDAKKQESIKALTKDNLIKAQLAENRKTKLNLTITLGVLVLLITVIYAYYRNKKMKQDALLEISEAKLASLKSLMDKHFISGSLNSIDGFLMNHDADAASDYLVKYSKLIRNILHFSTHPEVTLDEEIALCNSYLYLEKIHYDDCFDYQVTVDEKISPAETKFPSMLLQPIVENAVKHGMGSLMRDGNTAKGLIKINISIDGDKLVCRVSDNGKGLGFSKVNGSEHISYSGKGIAERVRVYNTLKKNKAAFSLHNNNPGVTAELIVPYMVVKQTQKMTA